MWTLKIISYEDIINILSTKAEKMQMLELQVCNISEIDYMTRYSERIIHFSAASFDKPRVEWQKVTEDSIYFVGH